MRHTTTVQASTKSRSTRYGKALVTAIAALAWLAAMAPLGAQTYAGEQAGPPEGLGAESYGYFRTLEGTALLTTIEEQEEPIEVEVNYPVLTGDSVWVEAGSRLEIELADGAVLRLDAGSELVFETLALSPDSPKDSATHLRLLSGEMQIYVPEAAIEVEPILIESENSQIYLLAAGDYWVDASRSDETRVAVRGGLAEAVTKRGSVIARAGEEIRVAGRYAPFSEVRRASREHDIELWALALEEEGYGSGPDPRIDDLDPRLRYAAAPLRDGGRWVWVDGRRAWRPTVRVGWRPFVDGRWVYTPSGLTWVPFERWGWVTAHYGSWSYASSYGWHWFPGAVYSPAWVHWYWGPSHVAWIPSGYYSNYYRRHPGYARYGGFRFGVYGWAGGSWDYFADWTFCSSRYFGRRNGHNYWRSGRELARNRRVTAVPRGVITTDTRRLRPETWGKPETVFRELETAHRTRSIGIGARSVPNKPMPDVTEYVARSTRVQLKPVGTDRVVGGRSGSQIDSRPILRPTEGSRAQDAEQTAVQRERSGVRRSVRSQDSQENLSGERAGERLGQRPEGTRGRETERSAQNAEERARQGHSTRSVDGRRIAPKPLVRTEERQEESTSLRSRLQRLRQELTPSQRSEHSESSARSERSETTLRQSAPRTVPSERLGEGESRTRFEEIRARLEQSRRERSRSTNSGESTEHTGSSRVSVPPARRVVESGRSRSRTESTDSTSRSRSESTQSPSARSAPTSRRGEGSSTRSQSSPRSSRSSASRRSGSSSRSSGARSPSRSSKQSPRSSGKAAPKKKD